MDGPGEGLEVCNGGASPNLVPGGGGEAVPRVIEMLLGERYVWEDVDIIILL